MLNACTGVLCIKNNHWVGSLKSPGVRCTILRYATCSSFHVPADFCLQHEVTFSALAAAFLTILRGFKLSSYVMADVRCITCARRTKQTLTQTGVTSHISLLSNSIAHQFHYLLFVFLFKCIFLRNRYISFAYEFKRMPLRMCRAFQASLFRSIPSTIFCLSPFPSSSADKFSMRFLWTNTRKITVLIGHLKQHSTLS